MINYQKEKQLLEQESQNWKKEKELILIKQRLKKQKQEIKEQNKKERKKLTTTKFLLFFLFTSCTLVEIITIYVTIKSLNMGVADFSALQMLIGAIVTEVVGFAIYSLKSLKENTKGGIVYETAMFNQTKELQERNENQEAEG